MIRLTAFALAMVASASAAFASSTVDIWLDGRAERIAASLSASTASNRVAISESGAVRFARNSNEIVFLPRALLAVAPDTKTIDAWIATLFSYQSDTAQPRKTSGFPLPQLSTLPPDTRQSTYDFDDKPTGIDRNRAGESGQRSAIRALHWARANGICTRDYVKAMRLMGGQSASGAILARRVIRDLGVEAYAANDICQRAPNDASFAEMKRLMSPAPNF